MQGPIGSVYAGGAADGADPDVDAARQTAVNQGRHLVDPEAVVSDNVGHLAEVVKPLDLVGQPARATQSGR
jgi:hypothetical protein